MSNWDMIILAIIVIHSLYRVFNPKKGKEYRSGFGNFICTFLFDILIYLVVTFILGLIFGASISFAILRLFNIS